VRAPDKSATVVDRALAVIAPAQDRMTDCEEEINLKIATLRVCQGLERMKKPPAAVRETLRTIETHLRAADAAAKRLPLEHYGKLFPKDRRMTIAEWRRETPFRQHRLATEAAIINIMVPPGGARSSDVTFHAAKFAHELLSEFSGPPTLYVDGLWPQLTGLLCEAVGLPVAAPFHCCRDYHKWLTGKSRRKR
jgi:hypothetical protein